MEKIKENFRIAIGFINKYLHAPIPEVYTVWYNYASGKIEALREELDSRIASEKVVSNDYIIKLYEKYFLSYNNENVNKIIFDVNKLIVELIEHITDNSDFFENGSKKLAFIGEKLKTTHDKEGIRKILSTLLDDLKKLRDRENNFTTTLKQSEQEFNNLHNELAKLRKEVKIDVLTGILNRRGFEEEIKKLINNENIHSVSIIFSDIDNFKSFNDTYGHLIGDEVLRYTAKIFKENLKGKDILARFGGEEFVVVILNTEFKNVITIAENLRRMVANKNLIIKRNKKKLPRITISSGVAERKKCETIEELIARADKLMYMSKQKGKNTITY